MHKKLGRNTVVLLGAGHTNAHVLRMWKMQPIANAQLVCVSNYPYASYSGMLPGVLAGQYPPDAMEIDLVKYCASADARLIVDEVVGLDQEHRRLEFPNRPPLSFDVLSIGIGSVPTFKGVEVESKNLLIAVKPMQTFLARLKKRMKDVAVQNRPVKISIVGGGIGSIEIAFCLDRRLQDNGEEFGVSAANGRSAEISLITGSAEIGSGLLPSTQAKVRERIEARGINLRVGSRVSAIAADHLAMVDGSKIESDLVIWSTSAAPPALLGKLGLETDSSGFISTRPTLQTVTNDRVFAVGDSSTIQGSQTAKAGVFAVRQGPFLWDNINRLLWQRPLQAYSPQKGFLKLVNTADGKSIAEYLGRSIYAGWCWKLKNRIDSNFMAMYQDYEPMKMVVQEDDTDDVMRCLGCGGKIGSELLGQVLGELKVPPHEDVVIGLENPDDAAVIKTHDNRVTVTTDFFASPFDDPYLVGRVAMLNSASDCCVMGAQPTAALAMIQLPLGHPRAQLRVMRDVMAGSIEELENMNATIIGGHSIEGPRLLVGFTIMGRQLVDPKTKGMLKPGDCLVMTKPLGTGVLLAGMMQSKMNGSDYPSLMKTMLQSNYIALRLITEFNVSGITDVTGFGLAGHLAEMLQASQQSAELEMANTPLLPGCQDLIEAGIESTLAPDNRLVAQKVHLDLIGGESTRTAALFDPQTSGGLLFGISQDRVEEIVKFLHDEGFEDTTVIGTVCSNMGERPTLTVK